MNMKFVRTWAMLALVMVIGLSVTGGTIAWFTDSVESTGNVIQSGNLKIDLELKGENGWTSLKDNANTPVFNYTLWEPGYTEMKTLKISNEGNLALKYELRVNPLTSEVKGPNGESLADVIDVYMAFGEHDSTNTERGDLSDTSVWWKCGTLSSMIAAEEGFTQGALLPASANASENVLIQQGLARGEIVTTLALQMQESAGNEYQNLTLGDASFTLNATQYTYEADSFDSNYDAEATYPDNDNATKVSNLEELKAALAESGNIKLMNDITFDNMLKLENGVEVTLDLNGKTIDFKRSDSFKPGNPLFYPLTGTKLTITGNGTVDLGNNFDAALVYPAGEVVIENGNFIRNRIPDGTNPDDVQTLFMGVKTAGASVVIKDGYFDGGYYDANAADIEELLAGTKTLTETEDDIAKRGIAADKNAVRVALKNNTSLLLNLSWSSEAGTQDFRVYGGTFVGANPAWGDEGCALPYAENNYLRPWSYYQGMFLDSQQMLKDKIELPAGYAITKAATADGRPTYTVNYSN